MTSQNERAEMNNRTAKHRIIMALCCMFALMLATIGLSAPAATAATASGTTAEGSLTVTYQYQKAALNNADINLYRLADWPAKGGYTPTGDFANLDAFVYDLSLMIDEEHRDGGDLVAIIGRDLLAKDKGKMYAEHGCQLSAS